MRNIKLEKAIKKLDREIEALKLAKKYLSNKDEIEEIREVLNGERQVLADELYYEDSKSYEEACDVIRDLMDTEIGREEQKDLLEEIKEIYGRQCPNPSKDSSGLNAWLKFMNVEYEWKEQPNSEWAILVIYGFGLNI